jgi:hypothetical protein
MVVRCTECGRVSPVHMVSAGARAVTIGAGVLSGVWVLACLVLVIGLGAALFGVTSVAFEAAVVSVREGRAEEGLRALVRGLTALFWLVPIALPFGLVLAALTAGRGVRGMSVAASGVVLVATVLWLIPVVDAVNAVSYARSLSVRDSVLASLGGIGWVYGLTLGGGVVCWSVLAASPWVLRLIVRTAGPGWVARAMSGLWEGVSKEGLAARRAGG